MCRNGHISVSCRGSVHRKNNFFKPFAHDFRITSQTDLIIQNPTENILHHEMGPHLLETSCWIRVQMFAAVPGRVSSVHGRANVSLRKASLQPRPPISTEGAVTEQKLC